MDLVTGGTGLLGAHVLLELLDRGQTVRALARENSDKEVVRSIINHYRGDGDELFERIEWVPGDLMDVMSLEEAMNGVDRVFHAAALVTFDPRRDKDMMRHNLVGTANMVNAALETGLKKFCHVSSTAGIGRREDGSISDERTPWERTRYTSPYALSKYEAELEIHRGIGEGLHAMMVNPCVILGPGPAGRSSMRLMETIAKGTRFYPPGLGAFVDARDVAWAMAELIEKAPVGERYLLVGEHMYFKDLFPLVASAFGSRKPTIPLSPLMLSIGWRAEWLRTKFFGGDPLVTRYTAHSAQVLYRYNVEKVKREIGMEFRPVGDMVKNVARYMRS